MSKFFVKTFNKKHPCALCRRSALRRGSRTYKVCEQHLALALERWRAWAPTRRAAGLCCYCDRKSHNGWLRCRFHARYNREKCREWCARQPNRAEVNHARWVERVKTYLGSGRCLCREHRPLEPGFKRCAPCRARSRATEKNRGAVFVGGVAVRGRGLR